MNSNIKLAPASMQWVGYGIIIVSVLALFLFALGVLGATISADAIKMTSNLCQIFVAVGLYLIAFAASRNPSIVTEARRAKAAHISLICAVSILIVFSMMSALYPQRIVITGNNLSFIAIITLIYYNVLLRSSLIK